MNDKTEQDRLDRITSKWYPNLNSTPSMSGICMCIDPFENPLYVKNTLPKNLRH
jgi:hypothetical protein